MSPTPEKQRGQMAIEHALLRGDVTVVHPQMTLNSRELDLSFDPTTQPVANAKSQNAQIKQMIARDEVKGRFVDPNDANGKPQSIDTDTLTVDFGKTNDNRSYPQNAVANGSVVAGDGKSELRRIIWKSRWLPRRPQRNRRRNRRRRRVAPMRWRRCKSNRCLRSKACARDLR